MNANDIHSIEALWGDRIVRITTGQTIGGFLVSQIMRDENNFHLFGTIRYMVWVKNKEGEDTMWKTFEGPIPITVTYKV